ncbi:hypothetical protein C0991_002345 [Blastosporella zonata]|nr:hypothetical protein C0991_002345 [Blastosporella zonata]
MPAVPLLPMVISLVPSNIMNIGCTVITSVLLATTIIGAVRPRTVMVHLDTSIRDVSAKFLYDAFEKRQNAINPFVCIIYTMLSVRFPNTAAPSHAPGSLSSTQNLNTLNGHLIQTLAVSFSAAASFL